jgi:hypothetical protein
MEAELTPGCLKGIAMTMEPASWQNTAFWMLRNL